MRTIGAAAAGLSPRIEVMTDVLNIPALRRLSAADAPLPGELLAGDPPLVWTDAALWEDNPAWCARADLRGRLQSGAFARLKRW